MAENLNLNISFEHVIPLQIVKPKEVSEGILLGLHGYAQMADNMVKHLEVLSNDHLDYCSLQAPHIFTTPNKSYVSTWMNSVNRENHVDYQIQYFNELALKLSHHTYDDKIKIGFGFSQGASSLYRMVFLSKLNINMAVIYAGDIPPEIKKLKKNEVELVKTKFILVHGDKDNVMSANRIEDDIQWLAKNGFDVELIKYEGNHNVEMSVLKMILTKFEKVL